MFDFLAFGYEHCQIHSHRRAARHDFRGGRRHVAAGIGGNDPATARFRRADLQRPEDGAGGISRGQAGLGRDGFRDGGDEWIGSAARVQAYQPATENDPGERNSG